MVNDSSTDNEGSILNDEPVLPLEQPETIDNVPRRTMRIENTVPLSTVDPNNRIPRKYKLIPAHEMMVEECRRHHIYCKFKLLRINCASSSEEKYDFYSYRKQGGKNNKSSSFYQRLFLVLDLKDEGGGVYYIIQNNVKHKNMWNYNRSIRDNGAITIGTTFCLLNPKPIDTILANDIPIIESDHPFVTLQEEPLPFLIRMNENLPADDTRGFVINGTQLTLKTFSCKTGVCSGYLCDRQRIIELSTLKKGCGCYHTGRNSSICFKFDLTATSEVPGTIKINDFTSVQFQNLFLDGNLPIACSEEVFGVTTLHYENLYDKFLKIIELVNNGGGWTLYGWSKRGQINDVSSEDDKNSSKKVESAEVTHHVVKIFPTSKIADLNSHRFDTSVLYGL